MCGVLLLGLLTLSNAGEYIYGDLEVEQSISGGDGTYLITEDGDMSISGSLVVDLLVSCDTIDTDADGLMSCGTDNSGAASSSMDDLTDADTTTVAPVKDEVLKFNGSIWVPAAYDYSFVFDFLTFSDGETTGQLIGSGEWQAAAGITFVMTYDNGPPTSAYINVTGAGAGNAWNMLPIETGDKTSEDTAASTHYPDATGGTITFTAVADTLPPNDGTETVTFYNNFIYDEYTTNDGFVDGDLDAMIASSTPIVTNDATRTVTQASIGASNYMVFAHSDDYTKITQIRCGTSPNLITAAFDKYDATAVAPLTETVSHSNNAGNAKTEDYYVYASKEVNLDVHSTSFTTLVSSTVSNYLRIGEDNLNTGWSNADFLALIYKYASTSDEHRTSSSFTPTGNYLVYAYPDGWGDLTAVDDYEDDGNGSFLFDGVSAAMTYEGLNTVVNEAGFSDSYRVYASTGTGYGDGAGTMIGLSSTATYSHFYYGVSATASSFTENECEAMTGAVKSSLATLFDDYAVSPGAGEYIWLCIPKRLGTETVEYEFLDGAFPFDFNAAETISDITNYNNFSEQYYAFRSFAPNLGAITVTIAAP